MPNVFDDIAAEQSQQSVTQQGNIFDQIAAEQQGSAATGSSAGNSGTPPPDKPGMTPLPPLTGPIGPSIVPPALQNGPVTIGPNHITPAQRLRTLFSNSAFGHSLAQEFPSAARTLGVQPSESMSSPTYAEHGQELLPLDELMPGNPQSHVGQLAKGALRGAGEMTSGKALATQAGIAATGGLLAPLAAGAGVAGAAGRVGENALKLGLGGQGAIGVGENAHHAYQQYSAGQDAEMQAELDAMNGNTEQAAEDRAQADALKGQAFEDAGAILPNAALMLPIAGRPLEKVGEGAQRTGEGLVNQTIGVRKADMRRGGNPGRGYLESGMGPSASMGSIADKASNVMDATGQALQDAYANADTKGIRIPARDVVAALRSTIGQARSAMTKPGGTGSPGVLDAFDSTFQPLYDAAARNESLAPSELWQIRKNIDDNTAWTDATQQGLKRVRQQTSGAIGGLLKDAVPETVKLNERYRNLKILRDRTQERAQTHSAPLSDIGIKALTGAAGALTGAEMHGGLGAAVAIPVGIAADSVPVKTTLAGGLYHGGRALAATGRGIGRFSRPLAITGGPEGAEPQEVGNPHEEDNRANQLQNPHATQYTPPALPASTAGEAPAAASPMALRQRLIQAYRDRQAQARAYRPYREPAMPHPEIIPPRGTINVSPEGAAARGPAGELPANPPAGLLEAPQYAIPTGEAPAVNETPGRLTPAELFPPQNVGEARVIRDAQGRILPKAQRNVEFPDASGKLPFGRNPKGQALSRTPTRQAFMAGSGETLPPTEVSGPGVLLKRGEIPDAQVKVLTAQKGQGKPIPESTARAFYQKAGGDPDKARAMAEKKGWKF